jgi:excinuclease ABC subunit B
MYADAETDSMRAAIGETTRRRVKQAAYNVEHGITPQSIVKSIDQVMSSVYERDYMTPAATLDGTERFHNQQQLDAYLASKQEDMRAAAANLDFEKAAALRDEIKRLGTPSWCARHGAEELTSACSLIEALAQACRPGNGNTSS